ncbi:hypothetical protein Vadar_017760 [Vaccinium darrowii]|uniref:Uncharacterized protein n=1 Tax=Vaccinium darrowii TaxID=229202 RepID=A0ACB7ZKU9_9ERIC|nr:hypothetical protein Vadar_017760 [Vaccinium darrowii]
MVMGFEEFEEDDDIREEFACPFCLEYFDIVGLCGHIDDEHPVEAKNGRWISRRVALGWRRGASEYGVGSKWRRVGLASGRNGDALGL